MAYTVVHLDKTGTKTVYKFSGTQDKSEPDAVMVEQQIHFDDSIADVKRKILHELQKTMQITVDELYLFCKRTIKLNSAKIYQILTKKQERDLIDTVFKNVVANIDSDRNGKKLILAEKSIYEMSDLLDMQLDDEFTVVTALGQHDFIPDYENPVIANPFNIVSFDKDVDRQTTRISLLSLDNCLILDSGIIIDNVIYVCTARDVLEQTSLSQKNILKLYFPLLYDKNINSLEDLETNPPEDTVVSDETYEKVNMFYDIYYKNDNQPFVYSNNGIKYAKVIIKPTYEAKIPIEAIFKIVHATQSVPIIKYNPSERQMNMYRIYTNKKTKEGVKIPYLEKSEIFKVIKTRTQTRTVSVFIEHELCQQIICEFDDTGCITVTVDLKTAITQDAIDTVLRNTINPIIGEIRMVLEQSGYKIKEFTSLTDADAEIQQLTYEVEIPETKFIRFAEFAGCVSSVFVIESSDYKTETQLRLKRVSYFNQMTSQEAFIIERLGQGYRGEEIVIMLSKNYEITQDAALSMVAKIANEPSVGRKTEIKSQDNPGFKTIFRFNPMTAGTTITVENINNIHYLSTIPVYLESIIRMTHNKTTYPVQKCKSSGNEDVIKQLPLRKGEQQDTSESIDSEKKVQINKAFEKFLKKNVESEDESDNFKGGESSPELASPSPEFDSDSPNISSPEIASPSPDISSPSPDLESPEVNPPSPNMDSSEVVDEQNVEKKHDENEKQIDGMRMKNPTFFQTRIQSRDPVLIKTEDTREYNSYSRICKADVRRQPIILNDDERKKIDETHKGFLRPEDVVTYGSNKDKKFHYICPRYWCLKTNTVIDPSEMKEVVENGKKILVHPTCGKILPPNETFVKPGHYVYEFYSPTKQKPNYKRYPGFQENSHPDGYCLPCCFDFHNTPGVTQVKNRCLGKAPETKANIEEDEYVKGPEKFPLETGRWGYLPIGVQKLLREDNSKCQTNNKNKKLKVGHPCLLRHGIEMNEKQSFLACISDILFYGKTARVPSIEQFKRLLMKVVTIDEFIKYQNGNLVTKFYKPKESVDISKHNNTVLFSKLNMDKDEDKSYYQKVVSSFENFMSFINDKDSIIDHTYFWDIVSIPNKLLFPEGVNLVILQIPNSDITNNVQIVCPSNQYSSELYESRKPTVFILKEDQYYEPLYSYTDNKKKTNVEKQFKESDKNMSESMKKVLKEVIHPFFDTICRPLPSITSGMRTNANVYTSTKPLLLGDLIKKLDIVLYKVNKLVVNYNNKVIGVIAENRRKKTGFVPCYPSAINQSLKKDIDYVFMSDPSLWNPYNTTVEFLRKLNTSSIAKAGDGQGIPCKPMFKIIEDELVVGILTETNQFIQLSEPIAEDEIKINEDIPAIKNDNYVVDVKETPMVSADIQISTSGAVDKDRVSTIKKIKLESNFYNVFRNTVRILLTDYKNSEQREKIESHMKNRGIIYFNKINEIEKLVRVLVGDSILFIGDDKYYEKISDISTCIVKDQKTCSENTRLCAVTSEGKCNLILPKHNLITKKENEPIYFRRISDELIRYSRIKSFMLKPNAYISFGNISYNLRDNEIIMMQSLLTKEYFDTLVPDTINNYVNANTRDDARPYFSQTYENKVTLEENEENDKNQVNAACERKMKGWITSTIWKKAFPSSFKEIEYGNCSFEIICDLLENHNGTKITIRQVKDDLAQEYETKYLEKFKDKIVDILISEGKVGGQQVRDQTVDFSAWINTEEYYLTPMDIWILVRKYEIPTIFISQQTILQTGYKENVFVCHDSLNDKFAFIVIPIIKPETIPNYKLLHSADENIFIKIEQMVDSSKVKDAIKSIINPDDFLTMDVADKPKLTRRRLVVASSTTSHDSSGSFDIFIAPKTKKRKKVIVKNAKTKKKKN